MRQGSADRLLILCSAPSLMEYTSQHARLRFDFLLRCLLLICFLDTSEPENSSAGTPCVPPGRNQLAQIQLRIRIRFVADYAIDSGST